MWILNLPHKIHTFLKVWIRGWPPSPQCGNNPHFLFFFYWRLPSVGGTCKRAARNYSWANPGHEISSAEDFYNFMIEKQFKTIPFVISRAEIVETEKFLAERFKNAKPFTGTQSMHHFEVDPVDNRYLIIKEHTEGSYSTRFKIFKD